MFTGYELQLLEDGAGLDRTEETRITEWEKNKRINQQLKVHLASLFSVTFTSEHQFS